MKTPSAIECLESRIAPATLTGQVLTYTDIDGDHVTVTISKGNLSLAAFSFVGLGMRESLQMIDLSHVSNVAGANITVSVVKAASGDGLAAIGFINAGANNLGNVSIQGDLGAIECGTGAAGAVALKSLKVNTLGRYGLDTQGGSGNSNIDIEGSLGSLTVHGDVTGVYVYASGAGGSIGSVTIGGSLVGGSASHSGEIASLGKMGAVKIGGDIIGGAGSLSGSIDSGGSLAGVSIGGSLAGSGQSSGQIFSNGDLGPVKIGGDVEGGSGAYSGYIDTAGKITSVTVGESVIGGLALDTGKIAANGSIGAVKIGQNLQAGPTATGGSGLGFIIPTGGDESGKISAGEGGVAGGIASITIGGWVIGGVGNDDTFTDSHDVTHNGQIFALGNIGAVKIGGGVQGGSGDFTGSIESAADITSISMAGSLIGGSGIDGAQLSATGTLGSVKIGGNLQGGTNGTSADIGSTGKLGAVQVGGSMLEGSIAVFGAIGTVTIGGDLNSGMITVPGALTKISIGGSVLGGEDNDSGYIYAGSIGSVAIGHNLSGGSISGTDGNLVSSGYIASGAGIGSVVIGGSVLAGTDSSSSGALIQNASIRAEDAIGSLTVKGDTEGTVGADGDLTPVIFSARGQHAPTATSDVAIGTLNIGGSTQRTNVLAGYGTGLTPLDGNAQIGAVKIGGDFVTSNLIAGAINYGANLTDDNGTGDDNVNFGDGNDHLISSPSVSKIGSITIGGIVSGTPTSVSDTDNFGIVAHSITSLHIDGVAIAVSAAPGTIQLSSYTGDDDTVVTL